MKTTQNKLCSKRIDNGDFIIVASRSANAELSGCLMIPSSNISVASGSGSIAKGEPSTPMKVSDILTQF